METLIRLPEESSHNQNIYEYKKVKPLDEDLWIIDTFTEPDVKQIIRKLKNKINELVIEQNHLMKDFELYKKAFKKHTHVMNTVFETFTPAV